jgi:hypothetical protein
MAVLPAFQRQVQFAPQPIESSASVFVALGQSFGKVEKATEQDITKHTKDALEANKFMLASDAINQNDVIFNEAQKQENKQKALEQYKTSLQSYSDEVLPNAPKENRLYAQKILFNLGHKGATKIEKQIAAQGQMAAWDNFNQVVQTLESKTSNDLSSPNLNAHASGVVFGGQLFDFINKSEASGTVKPHAASNMKQRYANKFQMDKIVGEAALARTTGGEEGYNKYLSNVRKRYKNRLTSTQINTAISRSQADASADNIKLGISKKQLKDTRDGTFTQALKDGHANSSQVAIAVAGDEAHSKEYLDELSLAEATGAKRIALSHASVQDRLDALAELSKPLPKEELLKPGIDNKLKYRKILLNGAKADLDDFMAAPATYSALDPEYNAQVKKIINNTVVWPVSDPRHADQVKKANQDINQYTIDYQLSHGLTQEQTSLIDGPEAQALASKVRIFNQPSQIKDWVDGMVEQYGPHTDIAMRNLKTAGLTTASNLSINLFRNPRSRSLAVPIVNTLMQSEKDIKTLLPNGQKDVTATSKAVASELSDFNATFSSANGLYAASLADIDKQVNRAALGLVAAGESPKNAAADAAKALILNNYNIVTFNPSLFGIQSRGGNKVRLPPGSNSSAHLDAMNSLYFEARTGRMKLKLPQYVIDQYPFETRERQMQHYIEDEVANASFTNTQGDNGAYMISPQGVPIRTEDGKKIGYDFNEIDNPNSDLWTSIASRLKPGESIKQLELAEVTKPVRTGIQVLTGQTSTSALFGKDARIDSNLKKRI